MEIDLTNILLCKTEVIYQGVICVFTHISRFRDINSNKVRFRVGLQDKLSLDEEDFDITFPQSKNTGIADWDSIKKEVTRPNSFRFVREE